MGIIIVESIIKRKKMAKIKTDSQSSKKISPWHNIQVTIKHHKQISRESKRNILARWQQNFIFRECQPTEHYKPLHCRYSSKTRWYTYQTSAHMFSRLLPEPKHYEFNGNNKWTAERSTTLKMHEVMKSSWPLLKGQGSCIYVRTCETHLCRARDTAHEGEWVDEHSDYKPKKTLGPFNNGTWNSVGVVVTCSLTTVQESNTNKWYWTQLIFCN